VAEHTARLSCWRKKVSILWGSKGDGLPEICETDKKFRKVLSFRENCMSFLLRGGKSCPPPRPRPFRSKGIPRRRSYCGHGVVNALIEVCECLRVQALDEPCKNAKVCECRNRRQSGIHISSIVIALEFTGASGGPKNSLTSVR